jgi:hypothetical protein
MQTRGRIFWLAVACPGVESFLLLPVELVCVAASLASLLLVNKIKPQNELQMNATELSRTLD